MIKLGDYFKYAETIFCNLNGDGIVLGSPQVDRGTVDGCYISLEKHFAAYFRSEDSKEKYLYVDWPAHPYIDKQVTVRYDYAESLEEKSWLQISIGGEVVCDFEYLNERDPWIDFASGIEMWDDTNFGHQLARFVKDAQKELGSVLV